MYYRRKAFFIALTALALFCFPGRAPGMTADQILEQVVKQNFQETLRVAVELKIFKGKKTLSDHSLWFVVRSLPEKTTVFIDFDEPPESRGLRFLFVLRPEQQPEAYMYLPATGKTVQLDMDDSSSDIGGTGLTMEDIRIFAPQPGEKGELVGEEEIDGHPCYLIRVALPDKKGERLQWISKGQFKIIRYEHVGEDGKIIRTFRVMEFFRTEQGKEFPREEEITIPEKNLRINIRQEHAIFGIEIPDQLMDPKEFGRFRWKS